MWLRLIRKHVFFSLYISVCGSVQNFKKILHRTPQPVKCAKWTDMLATNCKNVRLMENISTVYVLLTAKYTAGVYVYVKPQAGVV